MIKKNVLLALSVLCFLGAFGAMTAAFASPSEKGGWGGHHGMMSGNDMMAGKGMMHGWSGKSPMGMESGYMTARLRKVWNLDLSAEQRKKIRKIQRDLRAKVWEHEDAIENISDKLFELYKAEPRDAKAIGKVYAEIFDRRRQIIEAQIEAGNKVYALLTKEQLGKLKRWGHHMPKWGAGWGQ